MKAETWQGKQVLVTGHTGFKGAWLCLWLHHLGAIVHGLALDPPTQPSLYEVAQISSLLKSDLRVDIRDEEAVRCAIQAIQPEVIFHLAAQPLVAYGYAQPIETYAVNVMGTAHVLEAARNSSSVRAIVAITTDKCYENREWVYPYRETDPLGGFDPYSSSKACAELVISAYRTSFFKPTSGTNSPIALASARAGNVIGGGDWADNRLVPDCIRSFLAGEKLELRYPQAVRPWQHVLEPLAGYLLLGEALLVDQTSSVDEAWNFGPSFADTATVREVVERVSQQWGGNSTSIRSVPALNHEAGILRLDSSKALTQLGWRPRWDLIRAIEETVLWYRAWSDGKPMREYSLACLAAYADNVALNPNNV
jgi:CDP-glucose 4,6-dehydratase